MTEVPAEICTAVNRWEIDYGNEKKQNIQIEDRYEKAFITHIIHVFCRHPLIGSVRQ